MTINNTLYKGQMIENDVTHRSAVKSCKSPWLNTVNVTPYIT